MQTVRMMVVGARPSAAVALIAAATVGLAPSPAQAKPNPFSGYGATLSLDGSTAKSTERITRGACNGGERTLVQTSTLSGTLKLSSIGATLFSKPSGTLTEVTTYTDSAAGCRSENNVDTPIAATCTITSKAKLTPENAAGFLGVGFQKSGGSFIITALTPQFGGTPTTSCSPTSPTASSVGPALSGLSASFKGRVSANTITKHRGFTTTLLAKTDTDAEFDKYMCGDPDAETSCESDYRVKMSLTLKHK